MLGPFAGLRVVEFGRFIAGPYCAQLLADGGADVINVEPVAGDETRRNGEIIPGEGRQFLNKNRGKRPVAVDLSHPGSRRQSATSPSKRMSWWRTSARASPALWARL